VVRLERCDETKRGDSEDRIVLVMPVFAASLQDAWLALPPGRGPTRHVMSLSAALSGLVSISAFARMNMAQGDIKPANMMLASDESGVCTLIDFGTAQPVGKFFSESSPYSLGCEGQQASTMILCAWARQWRSCCWDRLLWVRAPACVPCHIVRRDAGHRTRQARQGEGLLEGGAAARAYSLS
jgi:hypothetical protein